MEPTLILAATLIALATLLGGLGRRSIRRSIQEWDADSPRAQRAVSQLDETIAHHLAPLRRALDALPAPNPLDDLTQRIGHARATQDRIDNLHDATARARRNQGTNLLRLAGLAAATSLIVLLPATLIPAAPAAVLAALGIASAAAILLTAETIRATRRSARARRDFDALCRSLAPNRSATTIPIQHDDNAPRVKPRA